MSVRMELSRILIRELVDHQIIELREIGPSAPFDSDDPSAGDEHEDLNGNVRTFPIVIGLPEAQAIERRLKGVKILRPQTHDLLHNVIESLGATLVSVHITDLSEHTFYAQLRVRKQSGEMVEIDSRPSDAIALGIGGGVPIFVEEHVLESAVQEPDDDD